MAMVPHGDHVHRHHHNQWRQHYHVSKLMLPLLLYLPLYYCYIGPQQHRLTVGAFS